MPWVITTSSRTTRLAKKNLIGQDWELLNHSIHVCRVSSLFLSPISQIFLEQHFWNVNIYIYISCEMSSYFKLRNHKFLSKFLKFSKILERVVNTIRARYICKQPQLSCFHTEGVYQYCNR